MKTWKRLIAFPFWRAEPNVHPLLSRIPGAGGKFLIFLK